MSNNEIIYKLLNGEIKLYQVDKEVSAKEATDIRREFLEKKYSIDLDNIGNYSIDMERASARYSSLRNIPFFCGFSCRHILNHLANS